MLDARADFLLGFGAQTERHHISILILSLWSLEIYI